MRFGWVTINVKDIKASSSFYEDIVGLSVNGRRTPIPGVEIVFLGFGGQDTEIELIQNDAIPSPDYGKDISIGFEVESLDEHIAFMRNEGIGMVGPYQPSSLIRFVYVDDPDGVKIQFYENL